MFAELLSRALPDAAPIVLVGRGGSGTRLLSELAQDLGVFLGNDINVSGDSVEWVSTIYDLALAAVTGDDRDAQRWEVRADRLRQCAASILAAGGITADAAWGWKLPETTLVVADVARAFPRARFVHLVRHPITSSLRRTHVTSRLDNAIGSAVVSAAYRRLGRAPGDAATDADYLRNAATWNFQVERATDALDALPPTAAHLVMRYEDICADPNGARERLARFLLMPRAAAAGARVAIELERMQSAPGSDADVQRVWSICGATAMRIGYPSVDV